MPRNIDLKIAIIRKTTGRQAAIDAGISEVRLSAAVNGRGSLSPAEMIRLAGVLGVPVADLAPPQTVTAGA